MLIERNVVIREELELNFLGDVSIFSAINQANDDQNPIYNSNPSHPIVLEFGKITENILDALRS